MKKTYLLIGILVVAMTLTACTEKDINSTDTDRMLAYNWQKHTTVSTKGGLNIVEYKLKYQDFDTNTMIYLCNKEGCTHKNKDCDADVFDIQGITAFFFDGYVYVLGMTNLNGFQLWRMNKDGTARKKIIDGIDGHNLNNMFLKDDKLYYSAIKLNLEDQEAGQVAVDEGYGVIGVIDLNENKAETLWNGKEEKLEIEKMIVSEDGLYCLLKRKSDDIKKITDSILSDLTLTEDEKILKLIEAQSSCEIKEKVLYIDDKTHNEEEKYSITTTMNKQVSLIGINSVGILMQGTDGYFYTTDDKNMVYQDISQVCVVGKYVADFDYDKSEISVYDENGESIIATTKIEAPEDYFDIEIETEADSELQNEIPGYVPPEPEEREWFLSGPFYSDDEHLFFDFGYNLNSNIWVLNISELAAANCHWHRGI